MIALAAGCGGGEESPPAGPTGPEGPPQSQDVTVRILDRYINGQEIVDVVPDLGDLSVAALIPDGSGGFSAIAAEPPVDGVYRIPGVPSGTYYLQRATPALQRITITQEREVELIEHHAGRPDVAMAQSPMELILDVTGMNPWTDHDYLELSSYGAGAMGELFMSDTVAIGATTLQQAAAEELPFAAPALIDGSRGDLAWLVQHAGRTAGTRQYTSIARTAELPPFTQVDGQPTALSAALQDAPPRTLTLDWRRSSFAAIAADIHPSATQSSEDVIIEVNAAPEGQSLDNFYPTLLSLSDAPPDSSDASLDLIYGNPFPAAWAEQLTVCASYEISLVVPDAVNPEYESTSVCSLASLTGLTAVQIEPSVSPPADLRVNGQPASGDLQGIGEAPVVSWGPPAVGTAERYRVSLRRYDVDQGRFVSAAYFYTEGTSVSIPPGLIQAGTVYTLNVLALSVRGQAGALAGVLVP